MTLPSDIQVGEYDVEIGIHNELIDIIYMCTDAVRSGSYYKIGKMVVG